MGIEEKFVDLSRRLVARTVQTAGRLAGYPRWEMDGRLMAAQIDDDAAREAGKDRLKALDAMSRFAAEWPGLLDTQRIPPVADTGPMPRSRPSPSA
ncbi:hypothetical protein [Catellatospora citrea]|uniref:Uncharacterized protein n=1 Tax=Catellatospora citrea TaxID=53366 RepID=A0A8J3KH25_9ACTN|nr:hypothetical protein [Catellatospora citrea]RKE11404.1 hypothetical protein C8E86_6331 [Catellatospora citrea]GIF99901.1 hypothetical protein Cci01nite_49950 [Catellatospora citrea]